MFNSERIGRKFASEERFLSEAQAAIDGFSFERRKQPDGQYRFIYPGYSALVHQRPREWKLGTTKEQRLAPYEGPAIAILGFLIRSFDIKTAYDVGAGRGYHSILMATVDGHPVHVHAFEMQPHACDGMLSTLRENPQAAEYLHPHHAGLSDHHEGERTLWFSRRKLFESKPAAGSYGESWWRRLKFRLLGRHTAGELREVSILLTSIDRFAKDTDSPPDLIKLDVDGYEALVVPGAMESLSARRPFLLFELHKDELMARFGVGRKDVVAPLFDLGYSAALITDHNDLSASSLRKVARDDPAFDAQATQMYLFY